MGKLISLAVTLAFLAAASGEQPKILKQLRIAQLKLIKDSQAFKWGKAWTPPSR